MKKTLLALLLAMSLTAGAQKDTLAKDHFSQETIQTLLGKNFIEYKGVIYAFKFENGKYVVVPASADLATLVRKKKMFSVYLPEKH